jgi:fibrillarin-like pre-rRNA processing protein
VAIALRNCIFLKSDGMFILMLKTRCVDVRIEPDIVLHETVSLLKAGGLVVSKSTWLIPYHQDHAAIICVKK